jgi:hypothetical protein
LAGGIYTKNGRNLNDNDQVKRVVDTKDSFIRIKKINGSSEYIKKSDIEKISFPIEDISN